jgi:hypothetical protein
MPRSRALSEASVSRGTARSAAPDPL